MDWTMLKQAEFGWNLSESQKIQLTERIYNRERAPLHLYLPFIWKPILGVAVACACAFALLLLWPKPPIDEEIVSLPGSSGEAQPDEYVPEENPKQPEKIEKEDSADEQVNKTPTQEQNPAANETTVPDSPADKETPETPATPAIHRFWETEKEMPYEEAVAIVKEKVEKRFNDPLTDKERMAYYQCISADFEMFYKGINKEYRQSDISLQAITTKDGIGLNLRDIIADLPRQYDIEDGEFVASDTYKLKSYDQVSPINDYAPNIDIIIQKNDSGRGSYSYDSAGNYYHNMINASGCGQYFHFFHFKNYNLNNDEIPMKAFNEMIRHYLSVDSVIWVKLSLSYKPEYNATLE